MCSIVLTFNASGSASKRDGFLKNSLIKIPFPKEAKVVETKARQLGMGSQVAMITEAWHLTLTTRDGPVQ